VRKRLLGEVDRGRGGDIMLGRDVDKLHFIHSYIARLSLLDSSTIFLSSPSSSTLELGFCGVGTMVVEQ
jgi:hypothetical protein